MARQRRADKTEPLEKGLSVVYALPEASGVGVTELMDAETAQHPARPASRRSPRFFACLVMSTILALTGLPHGWDAHAAADTGSTSKSYDAMTLTINSPAFEHKGEIPLRHTCDGDDVSPELAWSGAPAGTKSLALIVDDPDAPDPAAPKMTWVHWVLYNIPPDTTGLPAQVVAKALPPGTREGLNDWKRTGYGGPCPPIGTHRYFHKLYALDVVLPDLGNATKAQVEQAMQGHILDSAELVGTYRRRR